MDLSSFLAFNREHVEWDYEKTGHSVFLRIQRREKPGAEERPLKKPTRLAIGVEGGVDAEEKEVEEQYSVVLLPGFEELPWPSAELPEKVRLAVQGVLAAEGAERKQQVAAWVAEKNKVSQYAAGLRQLDNGVKIPPSGWRCARCEKSENLWLNLTDGSLLCGRKNWDGSGGNNHAAEHYEATGFPLAVKVGALYTPNL